jgi:arylformamidase
VEFTDLIDISMGLDANTVVWVDDLQPELRPVLRMPKDACNFTWLSFGAHAGTHVDAPWYLYSDKWTTDQIPLERLCGPCQVIDLAGVEDVIEEADVARHPINCSRVLLRTRNSLDPMERYNPEHVALSLAAAEWLYDHHVTTLGYDYQSFERGGANVLHDFFLSREVTLIDNLRLGHVKAGTYTLLCLPVKLLGIDGAPARAILLP